MNFKRGCVVYCSLLVIALHCAPALQAQESRWKKLNEQTLGLEHDGKYAEALTIGNEALKVAEATFGHDDQRVATALSNLATVYDDQGKYTQAESLFLRALGIEEKALGAEAADVATYLGNLASLYGDEGRYAEAEPLYLRALSIDEKALGHDDPGVAADLNNLAALYFRQGLYASAEPLYLRALHIDEKATGQDPTDVATDLNNLALLYVYQGKYDEAEPLYQRALHIDEKALGAEHSEVATDLNNLALLYADEGKNAEAEPLCQRALKIDEKALGVSHPGVATDLNNLAWLYDNEGKYADAEPLYQRALRIEEKAYTPDHPNVARGLNNLAALYGEQGKYALAEPLYQRALRIDEKALGTDHPDVATDLNNLALLYGGEGKYAEAQPFFQRGFDNLFDQFQYDFTYMSEKERLGFLDTVAYRFPSYFSFVHRFHEQDPQLIGSMYDLLLWEKSFIAGSVADMRRQVEASGDAEALKLLEQLAAKRTQIAALLNVEPPDRELWRKQIDQLRTEANEIEKALVARSSAFAEKKKLEKATWQQVRDALKPGEAAVEFARFRYYEKKWTGASYYVALVVTRETKEQPKYIFLGEDKQIEGSAITSFEHAVQTRGASREPKATIPGAQAYGLIWQPLETALTGITRIYLSPDGVLNQLPLGIIPSPDGKLQMERFDLRLLSSTRDILRSAPAPSAATALLVGDPVFDLNEEQERAVMQKLALKQQSPVLAAALPPDAVSQTLVKRDQGDGSALKPLPGTGLEVNAIAELMEQRQWKANVYTKDLALKRVVEQTESPRVVQIATHGFFLPDQEIKTDSVSPGDKQPSGLEDPMLRSGLYFAGANRTLAGKPSADGLDNGVLTAMEAGSLDLRGTELVVLSACNTGQGEVKNGEGVFGLRRAFEEAGAQSVLMSLWSVPDKETLDLMQRFYTKWLGGMEIHQALKEAQLEMREQVKRSHDGRDLPFYWGAFVLVGR